MGITATNGVAKGGVGMTKLSILIGCLLILVGIVLRVTLWPVAIAGTSLKPISFIILANSSFLIGILFKK